MFTKKVSVRLAALALVALTTAGLSLGSGPVSAGGPVSADGNACC